MFAIHHRRNFNTKDDFVVIANNLETLEKAKEARVMSGDLVVDQYTGAVVKSESWLFDWEKNAVWSYAKSAINSTSCILA